MKVSLCAQEKYANLCGRLITATKPATRLYTRIKIDKSALKKEWIAYLL